MTRKIAFGAVLLSVIAAAQAIAATPPAPPVAASSPASAPAVKGVEAWILYGTPARLKRDDGVPGSGSVIAPPLSRPAEPWTSGAVIVIPQALSTGRAITVAFWAKASGEEEVALSFQSREAPYTPFFSDRIALTPRWQRFVRTAAPASPLGPASQAVTLQLGQAKNSVTLGPVALLDGEADAARIDAAFAGFRPDRVAEAVSIASDPGVVLAATLRMPVGHGAGPFPIAICVQGHGPNGRGGFDVLMDRLLADGIATLDYDKRGIGQSTGTYREDLKALTRDAQAAVSLMRRYPGIDGSRIAIIGHSQGGAIAPAVAAADPRIAAIVSFAGPGANGIDMLRRQMHDQLVASGHDEAKVAPLVEASTNLVRARLAHRSDAAINALRTEVRDGFIANGFTPDQASGALAVVDGDQVHQLAELRTAAQLESLRIPVLELFAALDPLVLAPMNAAAAREALAGNPRGKVVVFDGMSHWFKEGAKTGSLEENDKLGPNIGSPRVVKLAGDWLKEVLAPPPAELTGGARISH